MTDEEFRDSLQAFILVAQQWLEGPPPIALPEIDEFFAVPSSIEAGQTASLSWGTSNVTAPVTIMPTVGEQPPDGMVTVSPSVTTEYTLIATNEEGSVSETVQVVVTEPTPPPPPPDGVFTHGTIPDDGYKSAAGGSYKLYPVVREGQRLSGTVVIAVGGQPSTPVPVRLLVDGVPQPSFTLDTAQFADGTHALAVQCTDPQGQSVQNCTRIVVINNSGEPFTDVQQIAVHGGGFGSFLTAKSSLAWGRVDVDVNPRPYPLSPQLDRHPVAVTDGDRERLKSDKVWWVEGHSGQPTGLWQVMPWLMKNSDGDVFVKQYNPESGGAGTNPDHAWPTVTCGPQYDGPRAVGNVSPYATIVHDRFHRFPDGNLGWIGVDKGGRVFRVDIYGEVTTILGPRSVAGVVGTDDGLQAFGLDARVAAGEKEYVGNNTWKDGTTGWLHIPLDLWVCERFPFEGIVADYGNNQVREIYFGEGHEEFGPTSRLMRAWPIPKVSSVWSSEIVQSDPYNVAWFAAAPDGLWCLRVIPDGPDKGHYAAPERVADIPNAFWVRGDGKRVFVATKDEGIYEYDIDTGVVTERVSRKEYLRQYVFMAVDEAGTCGPRGALHFGGPLVSKTAVYAYDTETWEKTYWSRSKLLNWQDVYNYWTGSHDALGHYMWGMAIHHELPKVLFSGICNAPGWFLWTACLGQLPEVDPKFDDGAYSKRYDGVLDHYVGLSSIFGSAAHGMIGCSCDEFRDYHTYEEARSAIRERLDPLFHPDQSEAEREVIAKQLYLQRTRTRF
jgi:hypothetical protein